ncbi:MAG: carboxypeptidase-like regulatory domain-containing protein [Flavihumibacter sp.]
MQKLLVLLFTVLVPAALLQAQEQFSVKGKVIDAAGGSPLAGASVFCQNTTFGVVTNADGEFSLRLPNGGYDLTVSFTGYQSAQQRITGAAEDLVIELKTKDKSLEEVAVVGSNEVPDGLAKYGSFFKEQFLGGTASAAECSILNPEALRFFFSKKRNRLKVLAREDLRIENQALGYRIRYQLDSLSYEYNTQISTFSGFPFFEMMTGTPGQEAKWKQNRAKAYRGSKLHFMRSWYSKTIAEEGFALEKVNGEGKGFDAVQLPDYYDSSFYHLDSGTVVIGLTGKYRVVYRKEMPDPKFVAYYKLPAHIRVQLSVVDILDEFLIEANGYWYDQNDIINTGYWSFEKVAEAVPYDYIPEPN